MKQVLFCLSVAALVVAESAIANAQSGVVLQFRGPRAGVARSAALRGARGQLEMVTLNKARRAARQASRGLNSRAGRRAIASALELDYIISGRVSRRGTRIDLHDHDGARLSRIDAPRPTNAANRRRIQEAVNAMVTEQVNRDFEEDYEAEEDEVEPGRSLDELEDETPPGYRDDDDDDDDENDDDDSPADVGNLLFPKVVALVGADARRRDISITLLNGQTRNYRTAALYPDITMHVAVRPLNEASIARGLYFQMDAAFAVGLTTNQRDTADPSNLTEVETSAWRIFGQVGYLAPLMDDKLQIGAMVGVGVDKFIFGENDVMASSSYVQLRAGIAGSYAILGPQLILRADFGYRHPFGAGDLASDFGTGATLRGFDVGIAATGAMDVGFTYGVHVGFTTYKLMFEGPAEDAEATDGRDNAFNMGLNLGWTFP